MMAASERSEARRTARSVALWAGILVPPAAWGAQLVMADLLFELGCAPGVGGRALFGVGLRAWALIVTAGAAGVTVLAGLLAYRAWRRLPDTSGVTWVERARGMGWWGLVSVGLYLTIIVFGVFPPLFLNECAPPL
jgi:hypothetical protein